MSTQAGLLEILLEGGRINEAQMKAVVERQQQSGQTVETLLLSQGLIDEEALTRAKGTLLDRPYADLVGKQLDLSVINVIPREVAENNRVVAFERHEKEVNIGLVDPQDSTAVQAIDYLAQTQGINVKYHIISNASFKHVLKKYEELGREVAKVLEVAKEKFATAKPKEDVMIQELEQVIKGAPVSRIVAVILRHAVDGNASDIHIEPSGEETRIRYRVDGILRTSLRLPKYIHNSIVSRIKVLASLKLDETRIPQDGRIRENYNGKMVDFRVSTLPLFDTEKVVMRVLDTTRGVPTLEKLGFRQEFVDIIKQEIRKPHGMFLITGPTGSGKSTTLFTLMTMRNEETVNISTLEDPIEYYVNGVNQSQVRPEVGFNFAAGLRALLRQDPNIIMVGEIRDRETGELAVHASLTGHLIFTTLHTNDALGVVPRLIDMHLEPFLLAATLNVVASQRLARRICERCKTETEITPEIAKEIRRQLADIPIKYRAAWPDPQTSPIKLYRGRGCLRCNDTGYTGRVAACEMIVFDQPMRDLIASGFSMEKVRVLMAQRASLNLHQDALLKALEGSTTMEEVMRISIE